MHRGELIQIDDSVHAWLEARADKAFLLVFVDDASSAILAAKFVPMENYFNYGVFLTPLQAYPVGFTVFLLPQNLLNTHYYGVL